MDPIDPFINQALADVLVSAYKGERMTQAQLVEKTGINVTTMQRLLAGKSDIDVIQLTKLADAIGTPPQELMEYAVERAERLSVAAAKNDLSKMRQEKQSEAQSMTTDQLENTTKRAATTDPELDTDQPSD